MIEWNTLLVKLVDGPGAGFTMIVLGILFLPIIRYWIRCAHREEAAFERGKTAGLNIAMINSRRLPAE